MERRAPHNRLTKINNLYIIAATSTLPHKSMILVFGSMKSNFAHKMMWKYGSDMCYNALKCVKNFAKRRRCL